MEKRSLHIEAGATKRIKLRLQLGTKCDVQFKYPKALSAMPLWVTVKVIDVTGRVRYHNQHERQAGFQIFRFGLKPGRYELIASDALGAKRVVKLQVGVKPVSLVFEF